MKRGLPVRRITAVTMVVACMVAATTALPGAVGPRRLARGAGQSRTRIGLVRVPARHSTLAGRDAASRVTPKITRPRVAMTGRPVLQAAREDTRADRARVVPRFAVVQAVAPARRLAQGTGQSRARIGLVRVLARRSTPAGRARAVPACAVGQAVAPAAGVTLTRLGWQQPITTGLLAETARRYTADPADLARDHRMVPPAIASLLAARSHI